MTNFRDIDHAVPRGPDPDLLASLARDLAGQHDLAAVWQRVVDASLVQVEGADHVGITVAGASSRSTPIATDDLARRLDECQSAVGEGPCLYAVVDRQPEVRVDDLRTDGRWPTFAPAAIEFGVLSILSFQLYAADTTFGALNIYADRAYAFDEESAHTGRLLAAHAAVAANTTAISENLRAALETRDVIGQAKGILMERFKITDHKAFDLLIAVSQHTNRKLREVAYELVTSGEIADLPPRPPRQTRA